MNGTDAAFMARALDLARRGRQRVKGNPMVGAVLVRRGTIVGEGWHQVWGGPHAEVQALEDLDRREGPNTNLKDTTLYVTLEPCCHQGKTPPCTDPLIARGLTRCVVAMEDPNPLVAGRGLGLLRAAGTQIEVGLLGEEARELNRGFITRMTKGRPFVTVKMALSLDGKIAAADGGSRWISGEDSRLQAKGLRDRHDAILVGIHTWLNDRPGLLGTEAPPPLRVVIDPRGRSLQQKESFSSPEGSTLLVITPETPLPPNLPDSDFPSAVAVLPRDPQTGWIPPQGILEYLKNLGVNSLLVEGGGQTVARFMEAGCVDRLVTYIAPIILGQKGRPAFPLDRGEKMAQALRFPLQSLKTLERDACFTFDLSGQEVSLCSPV